MPSIAKPKHEHKGPTAVDELPDFRQHERVLVARQRSATFHERMTALETTVATRRDALAAADRAIEHGETALLLGDITEADFAGLTAARRTAADAVTEAEQALGRAQRVQAVELRDRIVRAEDEAFVECRPVYEAAHRRIAERMAVVLLEASVLNDEMTRVHELIGGRFQAPSARPELRYTEAPSHQDYSSKLSFWIRELRAAGA